MKSLQYIVKDIRLSKDQAEFENNERALYQRINEGVFDPAEFTAEEVESIIPQRSDFAVIYNLLKKELRLDHDTFSIRALCKLLSSNGVPNRYVKVKYIIRVFQEMNILGVDEIDQNAEIYRFKYIYVKNKADLDKSNILRKLKSSFIVR